MKTTATILVLALCLIPSLSLCSQESKNEFQPLPKIYIDVMNETAVRVSARILKGKDGSKGCLVIVPSREEAQRFIEITESREQSLNWAGAILNKTTATVVGKDRAGKTMWHFVAWSYGGTPAKRIVKEFVKMAGCKERKK